MIKFNIKYINSLFEIKTEILMYIFCMFHRFLSKMSHLSYVIFRHIFDRF